MSFTRATAFATTLFVLHSFAAAQQPALNQLEQGLQSPAGDASGALGYVGFEPDEDITDGKGVHVKGVRPGTPADASGLKKGDLIVNIDGRPIRNLDDYDATVKRPVGSKLVFIVERAGRSQSLAVTLGARPPAVAVAEPIPSEPPSTAPSLSPPGPAPSISPPSSAPSLSPPSSAPTFPSTPSSTAPGSSAPPSTLPPPSTFEPSPRSGSGITAQPLDTRPGFDSPAPLSAPSAPSPPSAAAAPGAVGSGNASLGIRVIPSDQAPGVARTHRGAYVERVNPGSPAALAGLPSGAVIVQFDGRPINSDEDLITSIRASRPGQEIELTYFDTTDRLGKKMIRLGEAGAPTTGATPATGGLGGFGGGFGNALPSATTPPADSSPRPGFGGSNRPLLNRVENLARGAGLVAPSGPTGPTTVYDPLAMAALQKSVAELTAAVNTLDARLRALEGGRGGGTEGSAPASPSFGSPSPSFGSPQTPGFSAPTAPITPGFGAPTTPPGSNP